MHCLQRRRDLLRRACGQLLASFPRTTQCQRYLPVCLRRRVLWQCARLHAVRAWVLLLRGQQARLYRIRNLHHRGCQLIRVLLRPRVLRSVECTVHSMRRRVVVLDRCQEQLPCAHVVRGDVEFPWKLHVRLWLHPIRDLMHPVQRWQLQDHARLR